MLKLSQRDIKQGYVGLKRLAQKAVKQGQYDLAMQYIQHCATIAQQFNWIYADFELENMLKEIGEQTFSNIPDNYEAYSNRVVFYDDFHTTVILAAQYLTALVKAGKEVLYVNAQLSGNKAGQGTLIPYIQMNLPEVKIKIIPYSTPMKQCRALFDAIMDYHPAQILLHLLANSYSIPVWYRLPKACKTYIINLADQTFWLGAKAVDYVLEFRQFGVSVSQQHRGICPAQQLLVPFYPIVDKNPFQGFPKECTEEGKVLIFSGGDIYKVLDDKMTYWRLVKKILDTYPQVVFLFATKGDNIGMQVISEFIKQNHYEGRFIYTKFRPDINEVIAHVDIFMGTCPVCGSLMSQLAARNAKPILQYYYPNTPDDETEQAICYYEQFQISFQDEDAFMQEADRLIKGPTYRKAQGERLQKAMISVDQFNQLVKDTLSTNVTQVPLQPFSMDYSILDDRWFALEKQGYISSMSYIYGLIGSWTCLCYAPILWIKKQINRLIKK